MEEQRGIPLLKPKTAYQSLRESGFDFSTAIGELIDNSIDAEAKKIQIIPTIEERNFEEKRKLVSVITQIAVVDDGIGMDEEKLNRCPQLGYSSRYNDRKGLGRFGVGATYASISQCKRTIFYSRPNVVDNFKMTYIDLDEIANNSQTHIPKPHTVQLPKELEEISSNNSSTIVVWQECDRLQCDANGKPIESSELLNELKEWVSRAYRYKIWDGTEIYIDNEIIHAHDPLYLNTSQTNFPNDPSSTEIPVESIKWDVPDPNSQEKTSTITVKLTLLPEEWRTEQGDGGREHAVKRRIPENQNISILRNHREIAFKNLYPTVPGQLAIDRWWGCEINFEPELDECWEVKNIKRGANPIKELSDELKELLTPKIHALRRNIQNYWKREIPVNKSKHVQDIVSSLHVEDIVSSLMEKNKSVSPLEVESNLTDTEISIDDVSRILEDLAEENKWDWITDGTYRSYSAPSLQQVTKLESERKTCFNDIKSVIENSNIDQKFKDVALYDLEQARVAYGSRLFKACIVMFGAVLEGLMLGVILKKTTLNTMIANPKDAPEVVKKIRKYRLTSHSKPEELTENITKHLGFEDYKNIIVHLKSDIEKMKIEDIQSFRNAIHPWKSVIEPKIYADPSQDRAMHYLTALTMLTKEILT